MADRILDSSLLIGHWKRRKSETRRPLDTQTVKSWAEQLISLHQTDAIVTPVVIEFIAGFTSGNELKLGEAFLACFECVDRGRISISDWDRALTIARRIPYDGKPRQLGDCLIRAIADRLRFKVLTTDTAFPRRRPR